MTMVECTLDVGNITSITTSKGKETFGLILLYFPKPGLQRVFIGAIVGRNHTQDLESLLTRTFWSRRDLRSSNIFLTWTTLNCWFLWLTQICLQPFCFVSFVLSVCLVWLDSLRCSSPSLSNFVVVEVPKVFCFGDNSYKVGVFCSISAHVFT
jgi:hypothetical protein